MTDELQDDAPVTAADLRARYQRARPSRDMLNVSTAAPRRTVTVMFPNPNRCRVGSYTMESRLVASESERHAERAASNDAAGRSHLDDPVAWSMASVTGESSARWASWRATEKCSAKLAELRRVRRWCLVCE
jgi:hypothetical protein